MMRKPLSLKSCLSFLITCQTTFDSLTLLPPLLKVLKCSYTILKVFCEFSCVLRDVIPLSLDEVVGFPTNHLFL